MNCQSLPLLMNAALDGELSPGERSAMERHLAECGSCRDQWTDLQNLDLDLSRVLQPPAVTSAADRIAASVSKMAPPARAVSPDTASRRRRTLAIDRRLSRIAVAAVVCTLLAATGTVLQLSTASVAIAEIAMATGPIEYKPSDARNWLVASGSSRMSLPPRTRVRTHARALCEIRTTSDAVLRLNEHAELLLLDATRVELVAGELWCRASASGGLQICAPVSPGPTAGDLVFNCPSSTEMQWRALPNRELSCLHVADTPVQLKLPQTTCTIQPGECLTFASGELRSEATEHVDSLLATNWQLPLLALRQPGDFELRERLKSLLAVIGRSKAAYLYEEQIRQLGPAGAIPLIEFVLAPESREQPDLRIRAMTLAADLAPASAIPDLQSLLKDDDDGVRQRAAQALRRLAAERSSPDRPGRDQ